MSVRKGGKVVAGVAKGDKFPAGIIAPFAGTVIPAGWLLCDGSAIPRTDYADLFNAIGTTYGAGDGSTTFNLPNLQGVHRIIESGFNGNNWYRLYDDGWVEQGGRGSPGFLIGMANTNYTPLSTGIRPNFANSYDCSSVANLSTSGFSVGGINVNQQVWYTCGQSSRGAQQQTKYIVKY